MFENQQVTNGVIFTNPALMGLITEIERNGAKGIRLPKRLNKPKRKFSVNFAVLDTLRSEKKKSVSPSDLIFVEFNPVTKETLCYDKNTGQAFTFLTKANKQFLKRSKAEILAERFELQKTMAKIVPEHRVSKCMRVVQSKGRHLSVFKSVKHSTISLSNLQSCGSVWDCVPCAAKITERRRNEVKKAIEAHKEQGGSISFVTRTTPHYKSDSLLSIRDKFRKADTIYRGSSGYKIITKNKQCHGQSIKVFELTVSDANGWHFHVHELYFHEAGAFEGQAVSSNPFYKQFLQEFEQGLYKEWRNAALKAGFEEPSRAHGLQVQNGDFASDYLSKWGVEPSGGWGVDSELTKAHIKTSKKGFSPFDLIKLYQETQNPELAPMIQEYSEAMKGQKQLIWSRGLKARFGIDDIDDDDLVDQLEDDAEEIGTICPMQWKFIVANDLRVDFMLLASQGWDVASEFLTSFADYPAYSLFQNFDD
ncbi:MAG: hypothetical protein PHQ03_07640 [Methylococcales bacterium]|nr:hypothetical protein [Methylococcales bacterium]